MHGSLINTGLNLTISTAVPSHSERRLYPYAAARCFAGLLAAALIVGYPPRTEAQDTIPGRVPVGLPPEVTGQAVAEETRDGGDVLTIEEIVDNLVLSASNREESALTAPAWVLTITREEIDDRGYQELTDLLDDLPGMDVVRPYGDTYFRSYWRGYRNLIGAPYLLLVDGVIFNHLYLNEAEIMASFPISAVERVEVVFGPASAVYGANAAMGVINVITRAGRTEKAGSEASARFFLRTPTSSDIDFTTMSKVAELFVRHQGRGWWASAAARLDVIALDPSVAERFEYTRNRYYEDRRFYGEFLDRPELAGRFKSENRKQAIDVRLGFGDAEVAFQRYRMRGGTGLIYPADRAPNRIPYVTLEQSVSLRYRHDFSKTFSAHTLLRFRESHIDPPTTWLEFDHSVQRVTFQYWQSTNFAYTAAQDFSLSVFRGLLTGRDELVIDFGLRYERRDLERDYIRNGLYFWDPALPFEPTTPGGPSYVFPEPTDSERQLANRDQVDTFGAYALARLQVVEGHYVHLGFRLDYNSFFSEVSPIVRGGYVGRLFPDFTLKLLYGQAIRDPNRRVLFGGFSATGSNLELERERSQTFELGLAYQLLDAVALQTNFWFVDVSNGLVSANGVPQNVGRRLLMGIDVSTVALLRLPPLRQLKVWAYYSAYLLAQEEVIAVDGSSAMAQVGDLAQHKFFVGLTADVHRIFTATVLSRCLTSRKTVRTNPIKSVAGYCSVDANLRLRDFAVDGMWVSLRVTNLLDTEYAHPGIGSADSGTTPGRWVGERWEGSAGYFNSVLPQPGRAVGFHLGIDY